VGGGEIGVDSREIHKLNVTACYVVTSRVLDGEQLTKHASRWCWLSSVSVAACAIVIC